MRNDFISKIGTKRSTFRRAAKKGGIHVAKSEKKEDGSCRKFTEEEFMETLSAFLKHVRRGGYTKFPSLTNFSLYAKVDRKTVYNYIHVYFPNIKKDVEGMLSDALVEGTALGRYQPSIAIFTLKNWFNWTDKADINAETDNKLNVNIEVV